MADDAKQLKYAPMGDRLLVQEKKPEEVTSSGLILPPKATERDVIGRVIAVGPDVQTIKPGMEVVYNKYGGTEVKLDDEDYLILRMMDLMLVRVAE